MRKVGDPHTGAAPRPVMPLGVEPRDFAAIPGSAKGGHGTSPARAESRRRRLGEV